MVPPTHMKPLWRAVNTEGSSCVMLDSGNNQSPWDPAELAGEYSTLHYMPNLFWILATDLNSCVQMQAKNLAELNGKPFKYVEYKSQTKYKHYSKEEADHVNRKHCMNSMRGRKCCAKKTPRAQRHTSVLAVIVGNDRCGKMLMGPFEKQKGLATDKMVNSQLLNKWWQMHEKNECSERVRAVRVASLRTHQWHITHSACLSRIFFFLPTSGLRVVLGRKTKATAHHFTTSL